jgi:hypothetical protein
MQCLTSLIFGRAQLKRIGSQLVTGPLIAGLAAAYCRAINQGAVPTIATAWQGVAEAECRKAVEEGRQVYRSHLGEDSIPADAEGQRKAHEVRCRGFDVD